MDRVMILDRHRGAAITLAVAASLVLAACGSGHNGGLASPSTTTGAGSTTFTTNGGSPTTTAGSTAPRPPDLVAVTSAGALVRLDPTTGRQINTLVPTGVVGDELAVSPDGSSVFFEMNKGCDHQIWQIGTTGGDPSIVASQGSLPAISPTGNVLAYAQQPLAFTAGCAPSGADNGADQWKLVLDKPVDECGEEPSDGARRGLEWSALLDLARVVVAKRERARRLDRVS
jgi:Tol biopolymer transport system component